LAAFFLNTTFFSNSDCFLNTPDQGEECELTGVSNHSSTRSWQI